MRFVAYCRVSGDEQASSGTSLEWQRDQLLAWGQRAGWKHVEDIFDGGESGAKLDRAGVQRTIELLRDREADLVAFFKVDRAARTQRVFDDLWTTIYTLGGKVFVHAKAKVYDTLDELMQDTVFDRAIAEHERYTIHARTMDGVAQHLVRGSYIFKAHFGYFVKKERQNGYVVNVVHVDEREASVVRAIFDRVAAGMSYAAITAELNAEGLQTRKRRPWTLMSVQNVIQHREVYAGRSFTRSRKVRGQPMSATYAFPPIISEAQLAAVETAMATKPQADRAMTPFRGRVRCSRCGARGTAMRVAGGVTHPLSRYVLSCASLRRDIRRARTGLERDRDVECKHSVSLRVVARRVLENLESGGYDQALRIVNVRARTLEAVYAGSQREITRLEGQLEDLEGRLTTVLQEDLAAAARSLNAQIVKVSEELEKATKEARAAERRWSQVRTYHESAPKDWKPLASAIHRAEAAEINRLMRELGLLVRVDFGEPDQQKRWDGVRVTLQIDVD